MFKVGETVKVVGGPRLFVRNPFEVEVIQVHKDGIIGERWTGKQVLLLNGEVRKLEPNLETELRLCESRRGVLSKRIGKDQEEKKSLEKRIQELQKAIKERDKPKGRVKAGNALKYPLWLICASGQVAEHNGSCWTQDHAAMGNLFYDKESAERAVHDRKQRVLRGEDV